MYISLHDFKKDEWHEKKILIVDDDPGFRKLLSTLIRRAGYEVEEAKEGAEAVAAINKNVPDLVVLDIVMPVMGGYGGHP